MMYSHHDNVELDLYDDDAVAIHILSCIDFDSTDQSSINDGADRFWKLFEKYPDIAIITGFSDVILSTSKTNPSAIYILLRIASIIAPKEHPTLAWGDKPDAAFDDVFHVDFRDKLHDALASASNRFDFLTASMLSGCAASTGVLRSSSVVAAAGSGLVLGEGGEEANVRLLGTCLQLLGGFSFFNHVSPEVFEAEKVAHVSGEVKLSPQDQKLVDYTIQHIKQHDVLRDLCSLQIMEKLQSLGWDWV